MKLIDLIGRWWTAFAFLAAGFMLAAAHWFERVEGLAPCPMCLKQREVYWLALAIALSATLWALLSRSKGTPRVAAFLLFGVFTAGAIVAGFHAGGELKWWALPATCGGAPSGPVSIDDIAAALSGAPVRIPRCDVVAWKWLGVSMAGWNAIISAVLALLSLVASMRRKSDNEWREHVLR